MSNEIPFWKRENVVSVPEDVWRYKIRPILLKSKYAPRDDSEDINDFIIYDDGNIILPKYFWHALYHKLISADPSLNEYIKLPKVLQNCYIDVKLRKGVKPRDYQKPVIEKIIDQFEKERHIRTIVEGTPGFGKTFVAIYTFAMLKLKPIIIVHNQTLYDQWKTALLNYLDINEDDIGMIQGSDTLKIVEELKKPIVIAKIQSLLSQVKRVPLAELYDIYQDISLVIMDESHITSAAQKFAKVTSVFRTPNIIGLSATPYRQGIHQLIMDTNINTSYIRSNHRNLIPKAKIKILNSSIDANSAYMIRAMNTYVQKLGIYNKAITNSNSFIPKIAHDIIELAKEGRHILAIMGNNSQVEKLVKLLKNSGIDTTSFIAKNRDINPNTQVIVSNNQMSSTGFSIDTLDTLILANSNIGKVLLIQSIGRIVRTHNDKKQPLAIMYFTHDFLSLINDKTVYVVKNNLRAGYGENIIIETEEEPKEE